MIWASALVLEDVSDVDYEFTALRAAGFAFVKIDAAIFLEGLPGPGGSTPAANVSRQLGELGLTVIAVGIDDEGMRDAVLECGAPLGQGQLFGPARTLSGEVLPGAGHAAA